MADVRTQQDVMNHALSRIELFLLPACEHNATDDRGKASTANNDIAAATPSTRLDKVLHQVALADYIRTIQTMYRDSYDTQKLALQLRGGVQDVTLTTKHLVSKIVEGRSRSLALLRMTHGETSISYLRGCIDLASSYALQGLWPQV